MTEEREFEWFYRHMSDEREKHMREDKKSVTAEDIEIDVDK